MCCNKQMIDLGDNPYFNSEDTGHLWCCGECGTFYEEKTFTLDDEELISELQENEELLKETKIYKKLIK